MMKLYLKKKKEYYNLSCNFHHFQIIFENIRILLLGDAPLNRISFILCDVPFHMLFMYDQEWAEM